MGACTFPEEFCYWICDYVNMTMELPSLHCVKFLLVSHKTIKYEPQLYDLDIDTIGRVIH